jgi:hypothetical protein
MQTTIDIPETVIDLFRAETPTRETDDLLVHWAGMPD